MTTKKPCENCPFHSDGAFVGLHKGRAKEIASALMADGAFHCHKTVDYSGDDGGRVTKDSKLCIGAAKFLENVRPGGLRANFGFRIGVMCGELSPDELSDEVPVYSSIKDFVKGASV